MERIALVPSRPNAAPATGPPATQLVGAEREGLPASVLDARDARRARPDRRLLVGAEREGLPAELIAACERVAHIPIASDSLNAAMAATIALYRVD